MEHDPYSKLISELKRAITAEEVSIKLFAQTAFEKNRNDEISALYPQIREKFKDEYGSIFLETICENLAAVIGLMESGILWSSYTRQDTGLLNKLYDRCMERAGEVDRFLNKKDKLPCNQKYFVIISDILQYLDSQAAERPTVFSKSSENEVYQYLEERKKAADKVFYHFLKKTASIKYFQGMLIGVLSLVVIATAVYVLNPLDIALLALVFAAGAIGATISVLARMSQGKLKIDIYAGSLHLRLFGIFRVIIGSIFGLSVLAFVKGEILPLKPPSVPESETFFYCALAFMAGFLERKTQLMIESTAGKLFGRE